MNDPTAPLSERTPDQLAEFADTHLLAAFTATIALGMDRQTGEDYLRDRIVALSDSWPVAADLLTEDRRRRLDRLRRVVIGEPLRPLPDPR